MQRNIQDKASLKNRLVLSQGYHFSFLNVHTVSQTYFTNHAKTICFLYLRPDIYYFMCKRCDLWKVKGPVEVNIDDLRQLFQSNKRHLWAVTVWYEQRQKLIESKSVMTKISLAAVALQQILSATFPKNITWSKMYLVSLHVSCLIQRPPAWCLWLTALLSSINILPFYFFFLIFAIFLSLLLHKNHKNQDYIEDVINKVEIVTWIYLSYVKAMYGLHRWWNIAHCTSLKQNLTQWI